MTGVQTCALPIWTALSDYGYLDSTYIDSVFIEAPVQTQYTRNQAHRPVSVAFLGGTSTPLVRYRVAEAGYCRVRLYSAGGAVAATLVDGHVVAGWHTALLSKTSIRSGMYVCEVRTDAGTARARVILRR